MNEKLYIRPIDWAESHNVKVDVVMKAIRKAGVPVLTSMSGVKTTDWDRIENIVNAEIAKNERKNKSLIREAIPNAISKRVLTKEPPLKAQVFKPDPSILARIEKSRIAAGLDTYVKPTDWAESHDVKVDVVMKALRNAGVPVRTHMSLVKTIDYEKIKDVINAETEKRISHKILFKGAILKETPKPSLKEESVKIHRLNESPLKAQVFKPDAAILARIEKSQRLAQETRQKQVPIIHSSNIDFSAYKKELLKKIEQSKTDISFIQMFASFNDYDKEIDTLADLALKETWALGPDVMKKNPILRNFLNNSFMRILYEDSIDTNNTPKLKISNDQKFCIFNTGLADKFYEPIYAMFNKDDTTNTWHFDSFACSSNKMIKQARKHFSITLPKPAKFYVNLADLVFDSELEVTNDFNVHIVIDNCNRLPIQLIKKHAAKFKFDNFSNDDEMYDALRGYLEKNTRVCEKIYAEIKSEIERTIKETKWNFKRAIPIYYPKFKKITLLLPLNLTDVPSADTKTPHADVALAISKENGYYESQTILTMNMAYMDARLIVKPEGNWLSLDNIKHTTTNC